MGSRITFLLSSITSMVLSSLGSFLLSGRVAVSEELFREAVQRLKGNLQEGTVRRRVPKSFVQKIEVGNETGTLYYTFPLYVLTLDDQCI